MASDMSNTLKIAVTTRALFQLEEENNIYEKEGPLKYKEYQIEHEKDVLKKGAAFSLVKSLLHLNEIDNLKHKVNVLIVSKNSFNTSLRVFNSIQHYKIPIVRGVFTNGADLARYLRALNIDLFLTANASDAKSAIDVGVAAASLLTNIPDNYASDDTNQIRIAFDGDAVLFSDESELIYKNQGLDLFAKNESEKANIPLGEGPFAPFLRLISEIQNELGENNSIIRTALVTARSAPSHERVIKTLRHWNVNIDEAFFLGGLPKTDILAAFGAQIFFDDQEVYTKPASEVVPSGTVPYKTGSAMDGYSASKK